MTIYDSYEGLLETHKQLAEEQAQAELASAKDITQYHVKQRKRENKLIDDLRKQLAECRADRDSAIRREADQFAKDRDKLEQSQVELAEAQDDAKHYATKYNNSIKQLAEAQEEIKCLEYGWAKANIELAEAKTDWIKATGIMAKRLLEIIDLRAKLAASQAENARLRDENMAIEEHIAEHGV